MAEKTGKNFVVDTSVLIKWLGEKTENSEEAMKVKEDFIDGNIGVSVPALVYWELGSFLGRKFDPINATAAFSQFKNYRFPAYLLSLDLSLLAFKIVKRCKGATFYDASYHALALDKGALFLTADKKYYEKAKSFGHIKLLKDYM